MNKQNIWINIDEQQKYRERKEMSAEDIPIKENIVFNITKLVLNP